MWGLYLLDVHGGPSSAAALDEQALVRLQAVFASVCRRLRALSPSSPSPSPSSPSSIRVHVVVSCLPTTLSIPEALLWSFYVPLSLRLLALQERLDAADAVDSTTSASAQRGVRRLACGLAGPAAAGKSVLAQLLALIGSLVADALHECGCRADGQAAEAASPTPSPSRSTPRK
jgi:hypothetical protein